MTLTFRPQFVDSVLDGTKPHTIRHGRNWRTGNSIQFYVNRHKTLAKIRPDSAAHVVQDIYIARTPQPVIKVNSRSLTPLECQELSRRDGFGDFAELLDFFHRKPGLPFSGQLIGWTDLRY